jgi:hypothetical protein
LNRTVVTSEAERRTTIDHETIRRWAERCGGEPAAVAPDASEDAGVLRIRFPGEDDEHVEILDWETFFERFEERELALVYREEVGLADGEQSERDDGHGRADDDGLATDPDRWYELADRVFVGEF